VGPKGNKFHEDKWDEKRERERRLNTLVGVERERQERYQKRR
jgi:hypothetical protein